MTKALLQQRWQVDEAGNGNNLILVVAFCMTTTGSRWSITTSSNMMHCFGSLCHDAADSKLQDVIEQKTCINDGQKWIHRKKSGSN